MDPSETVPAKYCIKCGELKPLTEYYFRKDSGRYRTECKDCRIGRTKEYYQENRDYILEQKKQYHVDNRGHILEYKKQYQRDNRDRINEYRRNKYHTDDAFRIADNLRGRLRHALESQGVTKYGNTMSLVGCSPEWLVAWLNYTESVYCNEDEDTHIDHFFPFTAYDLSNPVDHQKVMDWRNLRVIPARMNMIKSNTMSSHGEINDHLDLINSFLKNNGCHRMLN